MIASDEIHLRLFLSPVGLGEVGFVYSSMRILQSSKSVEESIIRNLQNIFTFYSWSVGSAMVSALQSQKEEDG